jgi:hypothetical protein
MQISKELCSLSGTCGKGEMTLSSKGKKWSVLQVHHAVEANINTTTVCLQTDGS